MEEAIVQDGDEPGEHGSADRGVTVAAFDFDGTLADGGSVFGFLVAISGYATVVRATFALLPQLAVAAVTGGERADRVKETLFSRTLAGVSADQLTVKAELYGIGHWARRARPDVLARLNWHRSQGHRIAIVSASPECYISPIGRVLGVDIVIATRLAVDGSGRMTGGYEGANCRGEEKLTRVMRWVDGSFTGAVSENRPVIWAYGNSRGDRRLLTGADHGIDAGKLGRFGRLRSFTRLSQISPA